MKNNKKILVVAVPILILLAPFLYSLAGAVFGQDPQGGRPFLEYPDPAKYKECVRETEYMRFHHMDLLKELRIKVVRDGEPQELGFDRCRECHPNKDQFCNKCHDTVSLYPDCWGCHYYPDNLDTETDNTHREEAKARLGEMVNGTDALL